MFTRKRSRITALALALALAAGLFAGCGKSSTAQQVLKYNLATEPKTIDPGLNEVLDAGTVIVNAFEGLTRTDEKELVVPGVAEKWDISSDGLKYTFHLRSDAKWSDGKPVTAQDFEYAWKRVLNPETASGYAYQLYYLKNGEAYNSKKASADDVGVKALDDKTLEVNLEYPAPYFLSLTSFFTLMPVRKDIIEANKDTWATKPETYVSNGPFVLKEWKPKDVMVLEKNKNYWDEKRVKVDRIEMKMIEEASSYLAAFKSGQLDIIEAPPTQETPQLIKDGTAKVYPYLGTYLYSINLHPNAAKIDPAAAKALQDVRVRQALSLAIDRQSIVDNITKAGEMAATSFVAPGIPQDEKGTDFKQKDYYPANGDIAKAKELLAQAGYPDGKGFPKVTLMYNTSQGNQAMAVAVQDMWRKNLGIEVQLANQEWKVYQKTRSDHNYLIGRGSWFADYVDPMTFLDMWAGNSANNFSAYNNPEYDSIIANAKKETDAAKRMALLHQAEDMLMRDVPVIPVYYYKSIVCEKPYVKGLHRSPLGYLFFDTAYIEKQ